MLWLTEVQLFDFLLFQQGCMQLRNSASKVLCENALPRRRLSVAAADVQSPTETVPLFFDFIKVTLYLKLYRD